jgi:hypothetical protein
VGSESFSTISPTFFFGKGLGDLPDSLGFLRPIAITGVVGPSFPTQRATEGGENPTTLTWGFTVQYSLMYLQSAVKDVGLGASFKRLVALVEFPMQTCLDAGCGRQTTWTVNPGIAWIVRHHLFPISDSLERERSGQVAFRSGYRCGDESPEVDCRRVLVPVRRAGLNGLTSRPTHPRT